MPSWYLHRIYRIHPGVGVARIGNSQATGHKGHFVGPEVPDISFVPPPSGKYRDAGNDIRRQAVRFRIYEYTYIVRRPAWQFRPHPHHFVREITAQHAHIEWHVHLANRKGRDDLGNPVVNDPGEKTIGGINQPPLDVTGKVFGAQVQLGTLRTDGKGRLLLLGGFGKSASPLGKPILGLFSPGWYDDVSDGPVRATIKLKKTGTHPLVEPAWVIVGVPGFAHPITSIVTLYDLAYDVATKLPAPNGIKLPTVVSFTRHIYSVLFRAVMMQWAIVDARTGHSGAAGGNFLDPARFDLLKDNDPTPGSAARLAREAVFDRLKPTGDMPDLNDLSVTPTQYERFHQWSLGNFHADWVGPPVVKAFNLLTPLEQTHALDKTGLWTTVGGAFDPGIEAGQVMSDPNTYERALRIRQTLPPGTLTESLSVPWQADYTACGTGWWPGGRPDQVTQDGTTFYDWVPSAWNMNTMVSDWWKLGFIFQKSIKGSDAYVEEERLAPI